MTQNMLYRSAVRKAAVLFLVLVCGAASGAPKQRGPRAVGVVEWVNGAARLVPVSIFLNNRFYDAGVYKGTPVPMALEPDTVYEGERTGLPQGLFTIQKAEFVKRAWIGLGTWRTRRQATETAGSSSGSEKSKPAAASSDDNERPVLRRPGAPAKSDERNSADSSPQQSTAAPAPPAPTQQRQAEEDPNRPVLRRGPPAQSQQQQPLPPEPAAASTPPAKPQAAPQAPSAAGQVMVAVSDAGARDTRAYTYNLIPEDHQRYTQQLSSMAAADILRYANSRPGPKPVGTPPPRQATRNSTPLPKVTDAQLRALDLTLYNEPILVFSAKMPADTTAGARRFEFYAALIARLDSAGELHKIFSAVTDTAHLDALPRLELVDAVDAEGDGRGELLFRQTSDVGHSYVLYRVSRYEATELLKGEEVPN
jgi:hypothetical protein